MSIIPPSASSSSSPSQADATATSTTAASLLGRRGRVVDEHEQQPYGESASVVVFGVQVVDAATSTISSDAAAASSSRQHGHSASIERASAIRLDRHVVLRRRAEAQWHSGWI